MTISSDVSASSDALGGALREGALISPLTVEDLTLDGGGLARLDGRVIFLDKGLPGEVVCARIQTMRKRALHAQVTQTLRPSPDEAPALCAHFGLCGGCTCQNFRYEAALAWKGKQVRETLARIGGVDLPAPSVVPSPLMAGFRNKMSYAFGFDPAGRAVLGLRQRASHALVEVTDCRLQDSAVMRLLEKVRAFTAKQGMPHWDGEKGYLRHLVVHTPDYAPSDGPGILLELVTAPEPEGARFGAKWQEFARDLLSRPLGDGMAGVAGFTHWERAARSALAQGERRLCVLGRDKYQERFGPLSLELPAGVFLQTNTRVAALLYAQVEECAGLGGGETVWDLFCGAGALGLYLAPKAGSVYGVDAQKEAVSAAWENACRLGFAHCKYSTGDVAVTLQRALKNNRPIPDVIVADPPRSGMDERLADLLAGVPARRMLYVSCDAGTLSRDIKRLRPQWRPVEVRAFDMFPHTPHVETLTVLERN